MPSSIFDKCNHTELYQSAIDAGLPAQPTNSKEELAAMLEGTLEPEPKYHIVDSYRDAIMAFVNDYKIKLASQLTCPAKSLDPRACYGCIDTQVIACVIKNAPVEQYIQLRRKT